jgi:hypothetical protein
MAAGDRFLMRIAKTICAIAALAALAPASALAHDGSGDRWGHHHHRGVVLKGTVTSVDTSSDTLVVTVAKASRAGNALEGDSVTVKAVKSWVADTTGDGKRSIDDVQSGDTVLVFTKRRFVDADAKTLSAAFVVDKTHPAKFATGSDGSRDGHDCDGR